MGGAFALREIEAPLGIVCFVSRADLHRAYLCLAGIDWRGLV